MYIKVKNNTIDKYPYSEGQLKNDNPQISFPQNISLEILAEFDVYQVIKTQKPSITYKQDLSEGIPINENGVWKQNWIVSDKSPEESLSIANELRLNAYREESDPLFFKWQRGEATQQEWLDKVNEIKQRWNK